jgi:two-component system, NarL family, nitrate/nitrite response regulator NarL
MWQGNQAMRILIFSHIRLFGETLAISLRDTKCFSQVITCFQADVLVEVVTNAIPQIVLIDFASESALKEARSVCDKFPEIPVLAIALPERADKVISCADAGLVGYVPMEASMKELLTSIQRAIKCECDCHPKIAFDLLREIRRRQEHVDSLVTKPLTQRESEILRLTGRGLSNKLIARELDLSEATIKNHLHNIFCKLQIHSRAEALAHLRNEPWIV